ncbi:hypothetical protein Clacol_010529 [Clathrus columnatus]|uniref:DUF6593 domain-containing protein n=1 Tax=Clathrus columnatus TaxID=1419009 RepID=A0AAV5ARS1_9AGAM|nr:hypothetical protein Clacol_010529 [Clathrus columnatus]
MTTYGLPFFFEDTTGLATGPSDFIDIYDRPPFLRLASTLPQQSSSPEPTSHISSKPRTIRISELGARSLRPAFRTRQSWYSDSSDSEDRDGTTTCALISLENGTIKLFNGKAIPIDQWLKKSSTFGSTLLRHFKGSDGLRYQWCYRSVKNHEWACVELTSGRVVAHYDLRNPEEPVYRTSGNVLTIYEDSVHIAVEKIHIQWNRGTVVVINVNAIPRSVSSKTAIGSD